MRLDNIVIDGATTRLIAAARAVQAAEHLGHEAKESSRTLVALSRGARLYLEARQPALAKRCLREIEDLMLTAESDLRETFDTLVGDVTKALAPPRVPVAS